MPLDTNLSPDIDALQRRTQALATLDAIVGPESECRHFSFNARWSDGTHMASMRKGEGDDWFSLFEAHGAAIKGLAHESAATAHAGFAHALQRRAPPAFGGFLAEPAFNMERASYWRAQGDSAWHKVERPEPGMREVDDGSAALLRPIHQSAPACQAVAAESCEWDLEGPAIEHVDAHRPLTDASVQALNADRSWNELQADITETAHRTL